MKQLITALFVMAALGGSAQTKINEVASFKTETIVLGKLQQNVPATATFVVTNTSKQPLVIERASPSCGCTVADYTKTPIAPGKTGIIRATYNAVAAGNFIKTISVKFAAIDEVRELHISGEVVPANTTAAVGG